MCTDFSFFFFNDPATTDIYTLSLHDALPISRASRGGGRSPSACGAYRLRRRRQSPCGRSARRSRRSARRNTASGRRSEEHTSELQSRRDLVCRLLLEKKKNKNKTNKQRQ